MTIYNFGSVNIDHVYQVNHFVQPGETLSSTDYISVLGGKGANQSVALAKAGADVKHVGFLGKQDASFKAQMEEYGVDCSLLTLSDTPSGHAIIQVTPDAENAIVLFGGANQIFNLDSVERALSEATEKDWVLLQNETNCLSEIIHQAKAKGLQVAFNPAPMAESVKQLPLKQIDLLIVNEVECEMLTGKSDLNDMISFFNTHHPKQAVLITLGKKGVTLLHTNECLSVDAFVVDAKDTTAAGDTFIGYFLSSYSNGDSAATSLQRACAASAISVTRSGAAQSIPNSDEVDQFLLEKQA